MSVGLTFCPRGSRVEPVPAQRDDFGEVPTDGIGKPVRVVTPIVFPSARSNIAYCESREGDPKPLAEFPQALVDGFLPNQDVHRGSVVNKDVGIHQLLCIVAVDTILPLGVSARARRRPLLKAGREWGRVALPVSSPLPNGNQDVPRIPDTRRIDRVVPEGRQQRSEKGGGMMARKCSGKARSGGVPRTRGP